ncbi:DUF1398 family protein [Spirosoma endbachense]|uniref:DUF1398 domain-containing protein n=1 Tax=Spirosoma endbachense TaxID=2666025 RepID=A0A6P1VWZ4_9BACT|nr:DUF1398 family protein [Spirosoma endbachense]QHV96360.1 DUF1398 domain-containing protein [Spirosoma endbachense]
MTIAEKIHQAYATSKNYPDLAQKLIDAGVQSYTVDVASSIILYRFAHGLVEIHASTAGPRTIERTFDEALTLKAIRDNQEGKSDYPGFMDAIAKAGVRFYDAILNGSGKRVIYLGIGGHYEERIPVKQGVY